MTAHNRTFQVTVYDEGGDSLVRSSITEQHGLLTKEKAVELATDIAHRRYSHETDKICVWCGVPTDKILADNAVSLYVPGQNGNVLIEKL